MLLPIKNMSYLPIIRFKNRWQTFDLNLHYPYSVNGKIIKYTHLGYRGDACYIVDNECNTYYLPHDYAEIINDALKLHSNIYHECDTDSCRRQIITKLENINRREYGTSNWHNEFVKSIIENMLDGYEKVGDWELIRDFVQSEVLKELLDKNESVGLMLLYYANILGCSDT